jgi:hypothetical protein
MRKSIRNNAKIIAATNQTQQVDRDVFIKVLQRGFDCDSYEDTPEMLSNCIIDHGTMYAPSPHAPCSRASTPRQR